MPYTSRNKFWVLNERKNKTCSGCRLAPSHYRWNKPINRAINDTRNVCLLCAFANRKKHKLYKMFKKCVRYIYFRLFSKDLFYIHIFMFFNPALKQGFLFVSKSKYYVCSIFCKGYRKSKLILMELFNEAGVVGQNMRYKIATQISRKFYSFSLK